MRPKVKLKQLICVTVCTYLFVIILYECRKTSTNFFRSNREEERKEDTLNDAGSSSAEGRSCLDCRSSALFPLPPSLSGGRRGYAGRVLIENVAVDLTRHSPQSLERRFEERKARVKQVCHKYNLDVRGSHNMPNAWEFFHNRRFGLIYCNVFKAASSTWIYNFNLLAGYPESYLLSTKETPIALARKKYPRLSVNDLDEAMNSTGKSIAFMIARHPLERIVSAYRDKLQSGNRYYRNLAKQIIANYPHPTPDQPVIEEPTRNPPQSRLKKVPYKHVAPSFQQFVQYLIDSNNKGLPLDEHWAPMHRFCSPCVVDFDVYAKLETLDEDGNYIIYKSGISSLIKPRRINRARSEPTEAVSRAFVCQLTKAQKEGLVRMYRVDLELFDYGLAKYETCSRPDDPMPFTR